MEDYLARKEEKNAIRFDIVFVSFVMFVVGRFLLPLLFLFLVDSGANYDDQG